MPGQPTPGALTSGLRGPLPCSEGAQYAVTCVDTAQACAKSTERKGVTGSHHPGPEATGCCVWHPETIQSNQGTHVTGHLIRGRRAQHQFHLLYNPGEQGSSSGR